MILVIGATGKIGRPLVDELARRGQPVRCMVRRAPELAPPPGVELHVGDARDAVAIARALVGVQRVFVAMANGPDQREIELGIVQAAARAGVQRFVKISAPVVGVDVPVAIARMHYEIEQRIESSGMRFTHLRPYAFMQNLLFLAPTIVAWRAFFGITGDAPINFVDARDIAAVAAVALTEAGHEGKAYTLTGPAAVSYPELAGMLSMVVGARVAYVNQSETAMRAGLARARVEPWLVEHLVEIQRLTVAVRETPNDLVRALTGRAPRALADFLEEQVAAFRGPRSLGDRALGWWLARRNRAMAARG